MLIIIFWDGIYVYYRAYVNHDSFSDCVQDMNDGVPILLNVTKIFVLDESSLIDY